MEHDPDKYLFDMLDACRFVLRFTAGRTLDELRHDRGFRSAVERELQISGEALMKLAKWAPEIAEQISDHERIIGFRHVLVHGYDILDQDLVWHVVEDKLPTLEGEVARLLGEVDRRTPPPEPTPGDA